MSSVSLCSELVLGELEVCIYFCILSFSMFCFLCCCLSISCGRQLYPYISASLGNVYSSELSSRCWWLLVFVSISKTTLPSLLRKEMLVFTWLNTLSFGTVLLLMVIATHNHNKEENWSQHHDILAKVLSNKQYHQAQRRNQQTVVTSNLMLLTLGAGSTVI